MQMPRRQIAVIFVGRGDNDVGVVVMVIVVADEVGRGWQQVHRRVRPMMKILVMRRGQQHVLQWIQQRWP